MTFYNDNDPFTCAWLRELIAQGSISKGVVDERSIKEVRAEDVRGYRRVHMFCGILGWDYALTLAGWPADRPIWTGSCPCQPFSAAGKRKGKEDARDLWPDMFRLIRECKPECIFGEQVEGAIGHGWLDRISADLEAEGYAVGACVLGAHSTGAPHRRQRLFWVADSQRDTREPGRLAEQPGSSVTEEGAGTPVEPRRRGNTSGMGNASSQGRQERGSNGRVQQEEMGTHERQAAVSAGADSGWDRYVLIPCQDGKARRAEPGIFPLAYGLSPGVVPGGDPGEAVDANATTEARVARLRGYGNAIVPQVAALFIRAFLESENIA